MNRLEEISADLAKTTAHQKELQEQLASLEMEIADWSGHIDALNDEAAAIFMNLIQQKEPEVFAESEELTWEEELLWPSTIWDLDAVNDIEITDNSDWYPGKLTEDGSMQELPTLLTNNSHARFKELCEAYGLDASMIYHLEDKYGLIEGIIPAILIAETSGWFNGNYVWSGCYNLGNVWNNDRWNRICFNTKQESIEQVAQTLNNKYLWWIQTLWCLSNGWSCLQKYDTWYRYATSNGNWERNVVNVLEDIYMTDIDPVTFNFRK